MAAVLDTDILDRRGADSLSSRLAAARSRARRDALAMIKRENLAAPAMTCRIVPVDRIAGAEIELDGVAVHAPGLTSAPGELQAVAAAVCTLGTAIEGRISALFAARHRQLALALEDIGNEMLFRLADRSVARIRRKARLDGLESGIEVSPGDAGLALDQQASVLALAGSIRIAVSATGTSMLSPVKSLSLLVALGRGLDSRRAPGRCDCCPSRDRCGAK